MASHDARSADGFVPFFRRYAKTWVHGVATALLTAFGTLAVVNRWFVVLALAAYVLPPIVLYFRRPPDDRPAGTAASDRDAGSGPNGRATPSSATTDDGAAAEAPDDGGAADDRAQGWRVVDAPTEATLRDVTVTGGGAVYAVGDGGVVVADRRGDAAAGTARGETAADDRDWSIVLEDGPAAAGADLRGVDATADGDAVWIAGDGGAVARLEADSGRHTDYTAPAGSTDNWLGLAADGPTGDETILLINGSGEVRRGRYRDGDAAWTPPVKPGSGSSLVGADVVDESIGYLCDTNDGAFETTDGGGSFSSVGPVGADGTLAVVATLGRGDCLVGADDGVVHRYDGRTWTPERVADGAVSGLARREGEAIACSADGAIYERTAAAEWNRAEADAPAPLLAVSLDSDGSRAIAVGADGTVLERR